MCYRGNARNGVRGHTRYIHEIGSGPNLALYLVINKWVDY